MTELAGAFTRGQAIDLLTSPSMAGPRTKFKIPSGKAGDVRDITADAKCQRAVQTINVNQGTPDSVDRRVYAVTLGDGFAMVEDPSIRAGEYVVGFLIDRSLKRIVAKFLM